MTNPRQRASDHTHSILPNDSDINSSIIPEHDAEELLSIYRDGIIGVNKFGVINFINKTACKLTGWQQEEVKNQHIEKIFQFNNNVFEKPALKIFKIVIDSSHPFGPISHHQIKTKTNTPLVVDFSISPLDDSTIILMFRSTKKNQQQRTLLYQISHDPLTRLANRNTLQQTINHLHNDYKKLNKIY